MAGIPAVLFTEHLAETNDYTYNVREPGGALLASFEPDGENLHYYHFDALGSTVLVTNGSGTVSDTFAYDAWGNALSGGAGLKPSQYVGQDGYYSHTSAQGSALADLLQLGVRLYDPEIGRFMQRDPINMSLCSYDYASNEPTTSIDPSGLSCLSLFNDLSYKKEVLGQWVSRKRKVRVATMGWFSEDPIIVGTPRTSSEEGPRRGGLLSIRTIVDCTAVIEIPVRRKFRYHVTGTDNTWCYSSDPCSINYYIPAPVTRNIDYYTTPEWENAWVSKPITWETTALSIADPYSGFHYWQIECIKAADNSGWKFPKAGSRVK